MDPAQSEEGPAQPQKKIRRDYTTKFKVTRVLLNAKRQTFSLKMVKPDRHSKVDAKLISYPTVCLKEENAGNDHAFHIMHDVHHQNILSMKMLCKNELRRDDPSSVATFVEPYDGLLRSICSPEQCADRIRHIPSAELQGYLRQIVTGLDFLRKIGLYHGNLSWDSTLYHGNTVKLAGFKLKESMSLEEAQWDDWLDFLKMLEEVSNRAALEGIYYCGNLDSLMNRLKALDRTSLPTIKDTVLEHMFFWDVARRLKFFANTVSLKLTDARFLQRVSTSGIRGKSWDTKCTPDFRQLVVEMNDYRKAQKKKCLKDQNWEPYNGDSLEDYVRCICGACTHWRQMRVDADGILRENHPTVCSDVKDILEASERELAGI